jgi:hypothetical protein
MEETMLRKLYITLFTVTFIALMAGPVVADTNFTVTITDNLVADPASLDFFLGTIETGTVTFLNNTGDTINVNNTLFPSWRTDKDGLLGNDIANGASQQYIFGGTGVNDEVWDFTITKNATTTTIDVPVIVRSGRYFSGPTLSSWGILILVVLIATSGIWLFIRKRLAHKGGIA